MSKEITWYQPDACRDHQPYPYTAEKSGRFDVTKLIMTEGGYNFSHNPPATLAQLQRAHSADYLTALKETEKMGRLRGMINAFRSPFLQYYTAPYGSSFPAATLAAGAVCSGVGKIIDGYTDRVFCAVRPPGHHAGESYGEGFCVLNNVAIGALEAVDKGLRVAVIDFDRHHGNGTEEIIAKANNDKLLFISSYQADCKYAKSALPEGSKSKLLRIPLPLGSNGHDVYKLYLFLAQPLIKEHKPDIIIISAGFDLHEDDQLRPAVKLKTIDFVQLTRLLIDASKSTNPGVVSVLEGGYTLTSLKECAAAHVATLSEER